MKNVFTLCLLAMGANAFSASQIVAVLACAGTDNGKQINIMIHKEIKTGDLGTLEELPVHTVSFMPFLELRTLLPTKSRVFSSKKYRLTLDDKLEEGFLFIKAKPDLTLQCSKFSEQ